MLLSYALCISCIKVVSIVKQRQQCFDDVVLLLRVFGFLFVTIKDSYRIIYTYMPYNSRFRIGHCRLPM